LSIWLTDLRRKRQQVRKPAPKWGGPAVLNNEFIELSSDKFIGAKGKWVVLFFYPLVNIPFPTNHPTRAHSTTFFSFEIRADAHAPRNWQASMPLGNIPLSGWDVTRPRPLLVPA